MKIEVKNITGKSVGSIDLDDAVFGAEIHEHLLWEVVKWQLAKRRAGTASTKRLGEVRGSARSLEAEGHRPGAPGQPSGAALGRRWLGRTAPSRAATSTRCRARRRRPRSRSALSLRASEQKIVVLDSFAHRRQDQDGRDGARDARRRAQGADRRREDQRRSSCAARRTSRRRSGSRPKASTSTTSSATTRSCSRRPRVDAGRRARSSGRRAAHA